MRFNLYLIRKRVDVGIVNMLYGVLAKQFIDVRYQTSIAISWESGHYHQSRVRGVLNTMPVDQVAANSEIQCLLTSVVRKALRFDQIQDSIAIRKRHTKFLA